jgi:hypothetical protein
MGGFKPQENALIESLNLKNTDWISLQGYPVLK